MYADSIYLDTAEQIATFGAKKSDRTGTGTTSLFGQQMAFDISADKLPILTTKEVKLRSIIHELIWFLRGESNIAYLKEHGVSIWDAWADDNGELGPVYGVQWRHWDDTRVIPLSKVFDYRKRGFRVVGEMFGNEKAVVRREIDQIDELLELLRTDPDSRRLVLTAWNPSVVDEQALPPCHSFVQFYSRELTTQEKIDIAYQRIMGINKAGLRELTDDEQDYLNSGVFIDPENEVGYSDIDLDEELLDRLVPATRALSCHLYQRSGDMFLGVPFNIVSYSLLTHMIAKCVGMEAVEFIHTIGDGHIYDNHVEQMAEQMSREEIDCSPFVVLSGDYDDPGQFRFGDIEVVDYESRPFIKAPVAV